MDQGHCGGIYLKGNPGRYINPMHPFLPGVYGRISAVLYANCSAIPYLYLRPKENY